jgi:CRISPR system Cascade subunit CasA
MPEYDLLTEPSLGVEYRNGGWERLSLPSVLAALSTGIDLEFTALQAHQMHAWHAFLVQLGALAVHAAGDTRVERSAEEWCAAILMLTEGKHEPWCLVVEELASPAFLQPPVADRKIDALKNETSTPDEIDLLATAKNHDLKRRRVRAPAPEHWVFMLVSVQTMQGFSGKSNYGIARMNGGFSNRPGIGVAHDAGWSSPFVRDVKLLLESREDLIAGFDYRVSDGVALLWTQPWDGTSSLSPTECDPFFIEICRRIRLVQTKSRIVARFVGTDKTRVEAKQLKGNLGDPWIPVRREDSAALTAGDLSYKTLQDVLFGNTYKPSLATTVRDEDGPTPTLVARVLARGQGKTEGMHERILPLPARARRLFATADGRSRLGQLSQQWVEIVATLRGKVLRPALIMLLQGGPDKPNYKDDRCDMLARALDRRVDEVFFEALFDAVELEPAEAKRGWTSRVIDLARQIFHDAAASMPIASIHRYRALSRAERMFEGAARKQFPDVFVKKGEEANGANDTGPA